jgi:hypothetical protein
VETAVVVVRMDAGVSAAAPEARTSGTGGSGGGTVAETLALTAMEAGASLAAAETVTADETGAPVAAVATATKYGGGQWHTTTEMMGAGNNNLKHRR